MATTFIYDDLDVDFTPNPFTKDISVKRDLQAIRQSVTNILLTRKGEKYFSLYNMGVGLQDLYFELTENSPIFLTIKEQVKLSINRYEPRVRYKSFTIERDTAVEDGSGIKATITYEVALPAAHSNITQTSTLVDGVVITIKGPSNG